MLQPLDKVELLHRWKWLAYLVQLLKERQQLVKQQQLFVAQVQSRCYFGRRFSMCSACED
ncbi:hypothetical protein PR048_031496 [Dryococelus australis]|uniref:Uncharacterized protein n=1 Tax=Dryococelus australis TaxID=614101 RepID=A0ABQ9G660_9NEOP|nr:hypothetical protein PR048_031496 [Dryococelus australis]